MVPEGRNTAVSLPSSSATRSCSAFVLGSAPICSSPTSASDMALRMPAEGLVAVSLERSINRFADIWLTPYETDLWKPALGVGARRRAWAAGVTLGPGQGEADLGRCGGRPARLACLAMTYRIYDWLIVIFVSLAGYVGAPS